MSALPRRAAREYAIAPPIEPMLAKVGEARPLDRCFPELHDAFLERLPPGCVLDGEIVIAGAQGLDFKDAAPSRGKLLLH